MGLYFGIELFLWTRCAQEVKSTSSYVAIATRNEFFIIAIEIPCLMDVWEGHQELSQTGSNVVNC